MGGLGGFFTPRVCPRWVRSYPVDFFLTPPGAAAAPHGGAERGEAAAAAAVGRGERPGLQRAHGRGTRDARGGTGDTHSDTSDGCGGTGDTPGDTSDTPNSTGDARGGAARTHGDASNTPDGTGDACSATRGTHDTRDVPTQGWRLARDCCDPPGHHPDTQRDAAGATHGRLLPPLPHPTAPQLHGRRCHPLRGHPGPSPGSQGGTRHPLGRARPVVVATGWHHAPVGDTTHPWVHLTSGRHPAPRGRSGVWHLGAQHPRVPLTPDLKAFSTHGVPLPPLRGHS